MFGPSDAVEFVQKLLKVTAHFAFTCLSEKLVDFFMELIIFSGWFPLRLSFTFSGCSNKGIIAITFASNISFQETCLVNHLSCI